MPANKPFQVTAITKCLNKYGIAPDLIDLQAEIDETLSLPENWANILPKVKSLAKGDLLDQLLADKLTREAVAIEQGKANAEFVREVSQAEEEALRQLAKTKTTKELEAIYAPMKAMIDMVAKGYSNALIIYSDGGLGKTYHVISHLEKLKQDYSLVVGYTTPLQFYKALFEARDKLVVLDDVEGLLEDDRGLSILKSALWSVTPDRVVSYDSSTDLLGDIPHKFQFSGRIIFTMNHLPDKSRSFNAMVSRCLYYEFKCSHGEKMRILAEIAKQPYKDTTLEDRQAVLGHLIERCSEATANLNIRTLLHLFDAYRYDHALFTKVADELLPEDEDTKVAWELMRESRTEAERVAAFHERTGRSRATWFRLKKSLLRGKDRIAVPAVMEKSQSLTSIKGERETFTPKEVTN